MKKESNEIMYKMAELLLKKMQESGFISAEEKEKIAVLNIETFSPELAKVYLKKIQPNALFGWIYSDLCGSVCC